eukprot:TRINITY_DN31609_c0_g1_i1.p1 TRINITY_DN31609_c0_g1~~TRINITY_DN31609_c0_g1_i1.p1  ORF type:complete len:267 (-),score=39.79 TRINITY_DN31609_c0_g1_i1:26-826(-)
MVQAWLQLSFLGLTITHCLGGGQNVTRLRGSMPTGEAKIFRYIQTTSYEPWEQLTTVVVGQAQAAAICGGFRQLVMGPTIAASAAAMGKIFSSSTDDKVLVPTFTKVVDFETLEAFSRHITCLTPIIRRYSRKSETFKSKFQYYSRPTSISTGNLVAVEEFFNVSAAMSDTLLNQYHELFSVSVLGDYLTHSDGKQARVPTQSYTGFHQAGFGSVTSYESESDFLSSLKKRGTATPQKSIDQEVIAAASSAEVAISVFNATVVYTL